MKLSMQKSQNAELRKQFEGKLSVDIRFSKDFVRTGFVTRIFFFFLVLNGRTVQTHGRTN